MRVRYSNRALRNLTGIYRFIARDNPTAAARMLAALYAACDGLEHFPRRGRPSGTFVGRRELTTVSPYLIVYHVRSDDSVVINAIWHGAQNRR